MKRLLISLCCVLLVGALGCGSEGASPKYTMAPGNTGGVLDSSDPAALTPAELSALDTGNESALLATFGDPGLGPVTISSPPVSVLGVSKPAAKGASCYKKREKCHSECSKKDSCKKEKCSKKCAKPECICNTTQHIWETPDCCNAVADVTYTATVSFDGNGDKDGYEVIFSRDGVEVGRATTDKDGKASFTEVGVPRGAYTITTCLGDNSSQCSCGCSDCGGGKDCKHSSCKSGCGHSRGASCATCDNTPKCGCSSPDGGCENGVDNDGTTFPSDCAPCAPHCASQIIGVYSTCVSGSLTGKGLIDSTNPTNARGKASMFFKVTYVDGNVQGWLTYQDGDHWFNQAPITWAVFSGRHGWFGNGDWTVHVYDGGPVFSQDYFAINFPDDCHPYSDCGFLVGCYVKVSYKYTADCNN